MSFPCIPDVDFFDSPQFFANALHISTAISLPIHSFGLYMILFKTPEYMKTVKWYLINLHVWIVLFDYNLSFLIIPVMLFPTFAGYPLGILKYIDVNYLYPVLAGLILLGNVLTSIVAIFENRFFSFSSGDSGEWANYRKPWLAFHFVLVFTGISSFYFFVPDQKSARIKVFQTLPCLPSYIYESAIFVMAENYFYHLTLFAIFIALISSEICFFVKFLVQNIQNQLKTRKMSPKTYQLQRQFFLALAAQMLLPLTFLIIPCIYSWTAVIANYYKQGYINIAITVGSSHGLLSTIVMLFIHHPYREAMRIMVFGHETEMRRRKIEQKVSVQMTIN